MDLALADGDHSGGGNLFCIPFQEEHGGAGGGRIFRAGWGEARAAEFADRLHSYALAIPDDFGFDRCVSEMILNSTSRIVSSLTESERDEMFALMDGHYVAMTRKVFEADLGRKDEVILLHDGEGKIRGFTTILMNPCGEMAEGDVIYSGDTVIARECWGTQELVKGFCRRAGELQRRKGRKLFWFLISKGHRTYRYLPLFAKRFYPHPEHEELVLQKLAGDIAGAMFGDAWKADEGLIRFDGNAGHLREEIAGGRDGNPWVGYFMWKNPGWARGDELVCLTEMALENLRKFARAAFLEGFQ